MADWVWLNFLPKKFNQTQSANEWPPSEMAFLVSVNHLIVLLFFIFYVTSFGSLHLYKSIIILAILTYGLAHFTCISPTHKSQGLMLENMTRLMTWWSRQISFLLSSLRLSILIIKKNVKESRINCLKLKNKQVTRISTIYSRLYSLRFFFFFFLEKPCIVKLRILIFFFQN